MTRSPILFALAAVVVSSVAFAETTTSPSSVTTSKDLRPDEIRERVKGMDDAIGHCYLDVVGEKQGNGKLDITLEIHRKGIVDKIMVSAPNVPANVVKKIDACVKTALAGIEFPSRRFGTVAVVPYFYQRTPKAGPYESCWNPKGCPGQGDKAGTPTTTTNTSAATTQGQRTRAKS